VSSRESNLESAESKLDLRRTWLQVRRSGHYEEGPTKAFQVGPFGRFRSLSAFGRKFNQELADSNWTLVHLQALLL